jgi:hypothetical protein
MNNKIKIVLNTKTLKMLKKVMDDPIGRIIISVLLGLGLAALFRRACTGDSCVVIKAPKNDEVSRYYFKVHSDCYKYTPVVVSCGQRLEK